MIAEWIGKQGFARRAYERKVNKAIYLVRAACFDSIYTLSILKWWNIREKGDLTLLLKDKKQVKFYKNSLREFFSIGKKYNKEFLHKILYKIYTGILNEHTENFGWGENILEVIKLEKDVAKGMAHVFRGEYSYLTEVQIKKREIEKLMNVKAAKVTLIDISISIKKACQVNFNINECSVAEFYGYCKMIEK